MTGMELATVARYKLNPIVVLLNNRGYGTERHMQDGPTTICGRGSITACRKSWARAAASCGD